MRRIDGTVDAEKLNFVLLEGETLSSRVSASELYRNGLRGLSPSRERRTRNGSRGLSPSRKKVEKARCQKTFGCFYRFFKLSRRIFCVVLFPVMFRLVRGEFFVFYKFQQFFHVDIAWPPLRRRIGWLNKVRQYRFTFLHFFFAGLEFQPQNLAGKLFSTDPQCPQHGLR